MTFPSPAPRPPANRLAAANAANNVSRVILVFAWGLILFVGSLGHQPLSRNPALFGGLGGLGGVLAVQSQILVTLLLGRTGGQAPTLLMVGVGRPRGVRNIGSLSLVVRTVPLPLLQSCTSLVATSGLRARLLLGGLARVAVPAAIGTALIVLTPSPFWCLGLGFVLMALLTLITAPKQAGSTAWTIFRAPFTDERLLLSLAATPEELAAHRALMGARIGEARAAVAQVPAQTLTGVRLRVAVAVADGRHREALATLFASPFERDPRPETAGGELLAARAALFGMESGEIPREEAQVTVANAVTTAQARIPRLFLASEVPATRALLEGRAPEALALAKLSLRRPTDLLTRVYSLCTLAAAQAVTGDSPAARATLDRARALAPDLARIATVERLVTELPLTRSQV